MNTIVKFDFCKKKNAESLKNFIRSGGNINITDCDGHTLLHETAWYNHIECLQILIEAGADLNAKNRYGNTPLHLAARHYSKEFLQLLLEHGADPNIKNNVGKTPLEFIEDEDFRKEIEEYIQELSTLDIKEPSC